MPESPNRLTDEQLCEVISRRNTTAAALTQGTDAFNELYSRYARWLLAYLVSRVRRADLEDVAQVIWQRVWERIETGFHGGKFQVWLFFIARNYLIDLSRRYQTERLGDAESSLADPRDTRPESPMIQQEQNSRLQAALSRLGETMEQVVTRRLNGESYDSICEALSIPRSKAYKLLQQARVSLSEWMAGSALAPLHG